MAKSIVSGETVHNMKDNRSFTSKQLSQLGSALRFACGAFSKLINKWTFTNGK